MTNPYSSPTAVATEPNNEVLGDSIQLRVPEIAGSYNTQILIRRAFGTVVDYVTLLSFLMVPALLLGSEQYEKASLIWLSLCVAYFPLSEGLAGRSLGKVISRTRVVNKLGQVPGIPAAIVRTLFRVIEVNPLFLGGLPAGVIAALSKTNGRLGDIAARTYVITETDYKRLRDVTPATQLS